MSSCKCWQPCKWCIRTKLHLPLPYSNQHSFHTSLYQFVVTTVLLNCIQWQPFPRTKKVPSRSRPFQTAKTRAYPIWKLARKRRPMQSAHHILELGFRPGDGLSVGWASISEACSTVSHYMVHSVDDLFTDDVDNVQDLTRRLRPMYRVRFTRRLATLRICRGSAWGFQWRRWP